SESVLFPSNRGRQRQQGPRPGFWEVAPGRAPKAPQEAKQALQSLPAISPTMSASKPCSAFIGALRAHSPNETFSVKT
ncbi:hypothetical protein HPG69_018117, partial [Diceros bicornis minor]